MFSTYKEMDGEQLCINDLSTSKVLAVGKFILKMTLRKLFTLNHVFHISDNRINLVFNSLLIKNNFKMVFKCNKFIFLRVECL